MSEPSITAKIWPWRRLVQLGVLASVALLPLISRYGHYVWARKVEKLSEAWGASPAGIALRGTDSLMRVGLPSEEAGVRGRHPRKAVLARVERAVGSPIWSARLFGVSVTDPLAALESSLATRSLLAVLAAGAALPILATLLLGRVYCGWICPMGLILPLARRLRPLLEYLELRPLDARLWRGNKYVLLGLGGALVLAAGMPLLHLLYPPAVLSRESHSLAAALFDRAEAGRFGFPWGFWSWGMALIAAIVLIEAALAPGFWCASLCPGGALYSLLSRWKLLSVRRSKPACVDCVLCDKACPMQLLPMTDRTGAECDACGICVDACPTGALSLRLYKTGAALALLLALGAPAAAHHIIGIPHYAYDSSYPQKPVLRLRDAIGPYAVTLTGYPGNPAPGERTEIHAHLTDPAANSIYDKPIYVEAYRVRAFGFKEKVHEGTQSVMDMTLHKFHVVFPAAANYEVVLVMPGFDGTSTLRFPFVVGEPGSPWRDMGLFGAGLAVFVIGVRAVRIKRARARAREQAA